MSGQAQLREHAEFFPGVGAGAPDDIGFGVECRAVSRRRQFRTVDPVVPTPDTVHAVGFAGETIVAVIRFQFLVDAGKTFAGSP